MIYVAIVKDKVIGVVSDIESSSEGLIEARKAFGNDVERVDLLSLTEADEDMEQAFGYE